MVGRIVVAEWELFLSSGKKRGFVEAQRTERTVLPLRLVEELLVMVPGAIWAAWVRFLGMAWWRCRLM